MTPNRAGRQSVAAAPAAVPGLGEARGQRRALLIAGGGYLAASGAAFAAFGELLLSRSLVFLWLMGGLLILSLNDPVRWLRQLLIDWLPFILFLLAYDFARSLADTTGFSPHVAPQIDIDRFLFGGSIPTVFLQRHLYHPPAAAWYDYVAWLVYLTHFFATLILAAVLWRFAHDLFRKWRALVIWLSAVGFATYVLFPAVPPWLASDEGHIPHIERVKDQIFAHTGTKTITSAIENGWVDRVAALPSLHAAFPLMMLLLFWGRGWRWRLPLGLYTFVMALSLVYMAEHYVSDVLLGWLYALAVFGGVSVITSKASASESRAASSGIS